MNVLFVVPYMPNLIRVRPFNLIKALSAAGHEVTVLTLWSSDADREDARQLESHCEQVIAVHQSKWRSLFNCLAAVPAGVPLQSVYSWQPALGKRLQAMVGNGSEHAYQAVHVEHLRGARYALAVQQVLTGAAAGKAEQPALIWDSVDCISHLFRQASKQSKRRSSRWLTRFEVGRTERYERYLTRQFDQILVTSDMDRQALNELADDAAARPPIHVLTNGVDLAYFSPGNPAVTVPDSLILSGKMSYHANVSMAVHLVDEIMPLVWEKRPATRLFIVGKDPTPEVMRLASNPLVKVTGTVQDIREYLRQATVSVSPITYGAGIQNKILEAMACGAPVVTTSQGAAALAAESGRELMIGDGPAGFAQAILMLLENPQKRKEMAARGRRYVVTHHNWDIIARQLAEIYRKAFETKNNLRPVEEKRQAPGSSTRA